METTSPDSESDANTEIFTWLDLDKSGFLSVIEWSLEGGTVRDFWALLSDHDQDGKGKSIKIIIKMIQFIKRVN